MAYYIGQGCGILATICCFILPLWKKKWQMLVDTIIANLLFALNLILIGQISSGIIINLVAVFQTVVALWHVWKDKPVTRTENILFLIAFVVCGSLGFKSIIDVLPIIAVVFNMLASFQRDEQKTRILILCNASVYFSYYLILGASSMFAELLAVITTVIALIKYRKKKA